MPDFLYENPPLAEVIAEVHWEIQPLRAIPDSGLDPFYLRCLENLRNSDGFKEYRHEEALAPKEVPIEFFANKPLVRFRKSAGTWPLYQLGPGIFAVNIAPPYEGWKYFRTIIESGLRNLLLCYPASQETMRISRIELKYIDAFQESHGLERYSNFIKDGLGMSLQVQSSLIENHIDTTSEKDIITTSEVRFPIKKMQSSRGTISVSPGTAFEKPAVVVQFLATYEGDSLVPEINSLLKWLDDAHKEVGEWFEIIISPNIKKNFGAKRGI